MENNARNVKNKKRAEKGDDEDKRHEKKFDKKRYRLQKYSHKYKVSQWEERRKKAMLQKLHKELRKDPKYAQTLNLSNMFKNEDKTISNPKKNNYAFYKAKQKYQLQQEEKKKHIEQATRVRTEREEALQKYREKKIRNSKLLAKKTKKGQLNMNVRSEMLLEQIRQRLT